MDKTPQTDWIQAVATATLVFATIALAAVAAFQDKIRGWLTRPKLARSGLLRQIVTRRP